MSKYCILEKQLKSLPDHWKSIGVTTDQRRVMEVFEDIDKARSYIEESYGMYASDAVVEPVDSIDVMWGDGHP